MKNQIKKRKWKSSRRNQITEQNRMLLSTSPPQTPHPIIQSKYSFTPQFPPNYSKYHHPYSHCPCRDTANASSQRPVFLAAATSTTIREVSVASDEGGSRDEDRHMVSSAAAVAAAIRAASTSPVEFAHRLEKSVGGSGRRNQGVVLPSQDFQRLCIEQLELFRRIVEPEAVLSVYVRPADTYVMDQLELRCITCYPALHGADIVILVGSFSVQAGLRVAEAAISRKQVEIFPDLGAVVFPLVTHPFVVGFLVAEVPKMALEREWGGLKEHSFSGQYFALSRGIDPLPSNAQTMKDPSDNLMKFSTDQKLNAISIARSLAMAYVMDQKAMLLQQSSWQNNIRMSNLVEQIRGSLSSVRTLSKMLSIHLKRSEISYDIIEDILVQGDHMRGSLQQLQDAVYLTKATIMCYNNEMLKKMQHSDEGHPDMSSLLFGDSASETTITKMLKPSTQLSISSASKDLEFPMPPLALAPSNQEGMRRPCEISELLQELVGAIRPLAHKQQRVVELCDLSKSLRVAIEEPALRQALSNLIEGALLRTEVGGRIEILSTAAPAGGVLIIIDDDGPDMLYKVQMQSLAPFGADLFTDGKIQDNITWNFVSGLTVAREILEDYGCVVHVISPRKTDSPLGAGGTRLELWLPLPSSSSSPETEDFAPAA